VTECSKTYGIRPKKAPPCGGTASRPESLGDFMMRFELGWRNRNYRGAQQRPHDRGGLCGGRADSVARTCWPGRSRTGWQFGDVTLLALVAFGS